MKISEIVKIEQNNTSNIFLFKEGIFYRCYEASALLFIKNFKQYKVHKKFFKAVNMEVVYLGFPQIALDTLLIGYSTVNIITHDSYIEIAGFQLPNNFMQWKQSLPVAQQTKQNKSGQKQAVIINKLKEYPIVNKTPMEAFNFLAEIKQDIENGQL